MLPELGRVFPFAVSADVEVPTETFPGMRKLAARSWVRFCEDGAFAPAGRFGVANSWMRSRDRCAGHSDWSDCGFASFDSARSRECKDSSGGAIVARVRLSSVFIMISFLG